VANSGMGLISVPIGVSIFASLLTTGPTLLIFVSVAAFVVAAAVVAVASLLSGLSFSIFASGVTLPDIKGWALKFTFIVTFLTTFYVTNVVTSLGIVLNIPYGVGIVLMGIFSSMFVFGIFSLVSASEGE
jgi:hypothetical protein